MSKVQGLLRSIVFGPVDSRRYGVSLGINLLPAARKVCLFDCPYCECGRTDRDLSAAPDWALFPPASAVLTSLRERLSETAHARAIDAITLAGNGEPTLHPQFLEVIKGLAAARDALCPQARIIVLSNGSTLQSEAVREGLMIADERVIKIDAATDEMLHAMNSPVCRLTIEELTANIRQIPTCVTQTMFIQGDVDNTTDAHVAAWIGILAQIRPHAAQIYTVERRPASPGVLPVAAERLREIARWLREEAGVPAIVYEATPREG